MKRSTGARGSKVESIAKSVDAEIAEKKKLAELWSRLEPRLRAGRREGVTYARLSAIATKAGYRISPSGLWKRLRRREVSR